MVALQLKIDAVYFSVYASVLDQWKHDDFLLLVGSLVFRCILNVIEQETELAPETLDQRNSGKVVLLHPGV